MMQKDIPTLSLEQYELILEMDVLSIETNKLVKSTPIYPDQLSLFLKNYLDEINANSESKVF